jgi:putative hydrolase of the HAD superfamily
MRRQPAKALLLDLDGVLRCWDPAVAVTVEASYGLPPGALLDTAMQWQLHRAAVTGEITDEQWREITAERLAGAGTGADRTPVVGLQRARAAVEEWQAYRGEVDPDVLAFVREVRAAGLPVGLAANATERLDADLAALGLTDEVDVVVSSSAIKIHRPAPEFFVRACEALGVTAPWVLYVDDTDRNVRAARAGKLLAYRWTGPAGLGYLRAALAH